MGKYAPLGTHLRALPASLQCWRASFVEIEAILGFPLPASARRHPAWWANERRGAAHKRIWMEAGWRSTGLDLDGERIGFRRLDTADVQLVRPRPIRRPGRLPIEARVETPLVPAAPGDGLDAGLERLGCLLGFSWRLLGRVTLDAADGLCFPPVAPRAGVLRLGVLQPDGRRRNYIAEGIDLAALVAGWRQSTAQDGGPRLARLLQQALALGQEVEVALLQAPVWRSERSVQSWPADLAEEVVRRLFHATALMLDGAVDPAELEPVAVNDAEESPDTVANCGD